MFCNLINSVFLVRREKHDFLHYDDVSFFALERFSSTKAANVRQFQAHDDYLERDSRQVLSLAEEETPSQSGDDDLEDIQPFRAAPDKIILY